MAQQIVNIGTTVNDRSGDPLRTAFNKINENFTEIYNSNVMATEDRLIKDGAELTLHVGGANNPFVTFPAYEGGNIQIQSTEILAVDTTGVLGSTHNIQIHTSALENIKSWEFDTSGSITTPTTIPTTFTAILDDTHMTTPITLSGTPWQFEVTFQDNGTGSVETQISNNTPWFDNPGYTDGQEFEFTVTDHGIPNYVFTLGLYDVTAVPAGWTTNLIASIPPEYPATIQSAGAIKLSANGETLVLGTDGSLNITGDILSNNIAGITIGSNFDVFVIADRTDNNHTWKFDGSSGALQLPVNGDIVDSNGVSVLTTGGSTGDVTFSGVAIKGLNNSLVLQANADDTVYGVELFNSIDNDTHIKPLDPNKGIAIGFAYGSAQSHVRVEGTNGQGNIPYSGDRVAIYSAGTTIQNNEYYNTIDFFTDKEPVGYPGALAFWSAKVGEIEVDMFIPPASAFATFLIARNVGDTVEIDYSTAGGVVTYTATITTAFYYIGQDDIDGNQRYTGRISGEVPVDQIGVLGINFPISTTNTAEWKFDKTGDIVFPDATRQTTAYPGIVNLANGSETLAVGVNEATVDYLKVRIVAGMGNTLNVEIQYNREVGSTIMVTSTTVATGVADASLNVFNGETTLPANTTTWYNINANTLSTVGDLVTAIFADNSFHKMYRITVYARTMPAVGDLGDAYCSIEVLK